jgi:hypothetical protein
LFFPYSIGADRHQMRATTANEAHTRMAGQLQDLLDEHPRAHEERSSRETTDQ